MKRRNKTEVEDRVIGDFCHLVGSRLNQTMAVLCRPDREPQNHIEKSKDREKKCDAIISRDGERWAFDVTEIASYVGQQHDVGRLGPIKCLVETDLTTRYPDFDLEISIQLPEEFMRKGKAKGGVKNTLAGVLLDTLPKYVDETPEDADGRFCEFKDALFPLIVVTKWPRHGALASCDLGLVSRSVEQPCEDAIGAALRDKDNQLEHYKETGFSTAIIMDSYDSCLGSAHGAGRAFCTAWQGYQTKYIDEIWLARSTLTTCIFFCLKRAGYLYSGGAFERIFGEHYQ